MLAVFIRWILSGASLPASAILSGKFSLKQLCSGSGAQVPALLTSKVCATIAGAHTKDAKSRPDNRALKGRGGLPKGQGLPFDYTKFSIWI